MTKAIPNICYICGITAVGIKLNGAHVCGTCMDDHFPQKEEKKVVTEREELLDLDLDLDLSEWLAEQKTPTFLGKE